MASPAGGQPAAADPTASTALPDLPPRQPGVLARYPRRLKLGLAGGLLVALAGAGLSIGLLSDYAHRARQTAPPRLVELQGLDTPPSSPMAMPAAEPPAENGGAITQFPALNAQDDRSVQLAPAPDPGLTEDLPHGGLPRIGKDGRLPWQAYARPFDQADQRPRIALVIADLGLSKVASDAAITRLPAMVTLAFDAQSPNAAAWLSRARADGHETLLMVPMEPFDYPRSDPGPDTLLTSLPNADNVQRLHHALMQGAGYTGIMTLTGTRLVTDTDKLQPVLQALKERGLLFFDAHNAPHDVGMELAHGLQLPAVAATLALDQNPAPAAIDQALAELERSARQNGFAVGIAAPLPVVLDRLTAWLAQLPADGIALAPVSALAALAGATPSQPASSAAASAADGSAGGALGAAAHK